MERCGARNRAGEPCRRWPMKNGTGRCRMHGGTSLSGLAHPNLKTGRYSKSIPTRLAGAYAQAQADRELTSCRDELNLVDARLADVLSRVDTGEAGKAWRAAQAGLRAYHKARPGPDRDEAIEAVEAAVGEGLGDYAAWGEVLELVERRRRLVETETKRLAAMNQFITNEPAMVMLGAVLDVVKSNVTDRGTLQAISAGIGRLVHAEAPAH